MALTAWAGTRATMARTDGRKPMRGANPTNLVVVRIESATRLVKSELLIANQNVAEYVRALYTPVTPWGGLLKVVSPNLEDDHYGGFKTGVVVTRWPRGTWAGSPPQRCEATLQVHISFLSVWLMRWWRQAAESATKL